LQETQVRDNIFVWTLGGDTIHTSYGTNCIGVIEPDAVLVVDPLIAPAHARLVVATIREKTPAPVRFVVLTHHHTDHSLGASTLVHDGAVLIANRNCRDSMAAEHPRLLALRRQQPETRELFGDAVPILPSVTFEESLTVHLGDMEIELWHPGWGHTPGDVFLFLPDARVAICGDLLFHGYHFNFENASLPGIRQGLRALRALDAETFIPGHGQVAGPETLDEQAHYLDAVESGVQRGIKEGKADDAIAAELLQMFPTHRLGFVIFDTVARLKETTPPPS